VNKDKTQFYLISTFGGKFFYDYKKLAEKTSLLNQIREAGFKISYNVKFKRPGDKDWQEIKDMEKIYAM